MSRKTLLALCITLINLPTYAASPAPTQADLWKAIKEQQATIDALKAKLDTNEQQTKANAQNLDNAEKKIEATVDALHTATTETTHKTVIGGYGELHYNQWNNSLATGKDKREIDFHRFVLLFAHEFNNDVRFFSEFELEHAVAGEGKKGEVELEQAYIQWSYANKHSTKAGVFLVPVGIINETHEPDAFYGVERNSVENKIIPSTWWEGGLAFSGELAEGWSYDVAAHSGLALADKKFLVRDGRQKASEANANGKAYTGRIKFTGISGLELAASIQHQEDFWQNAGTRTLAANLIEAHAIYQINDFSLRALYANWDIDDAINAVAAGSDQQTGWYLEPSYRLNDQWGVFARYSNWDNQASDNVESTYREVSTGLNFWLTPRTVAKIDLFTQNNPTNKDEFQGFNLGIGYSF